MRRFGPPGDDEVLGRLGRRRLVAVGAGLDAADRVDDEAVGAEQEAQLARACSSPVHRSTSATSPVGERTSVRSWDTPVAASNVAVVVVADGEVGVERARAPAVPRVAGRGPSRRPRRRPRRRAVISPKAPWHRQITASNSASNGSARASRRSNVAPAARRRGPGRRTSAAMSIPCTTIPRRASSWAWRPGPHPTSSTRDPGASPSADDDVVDLLHRPLRERVPQVRRPEVVGDRLEPVLMARVRSKTRSLGCLAAPGGARPPADARPDRSSARCGRGPKRSRRSLRGRHASSSAISFRPRWCPTRR